MYILQLQYVDFSSEKSRSSHFSLEMRTSQAERPVSITKGSDSFDSDTNPDYENEFDAEGIVDIGVFRPEDKIALLTY